MTTSLLPTRIPPTPDDTATIALGADPVVRNLQITLAYYDLSSACCGVVTTGANWCTFATWASHQAGQTIRGEDLVDNLSRRALMPTPLLSISDRIGKWLVRRGLFNPHTRLGRLAAAVSSPLQGLEAASRQIGDGNKKVFEEIGHEFARFLATRAGDDAPDDAAIDAFCASLRPGPPPDGQDRLKEAFRNYYKAKFTQDPIERAQLEYLGNLLIGFHEQIRLQAQIEGGMTEPVIDEFTWGLDLLGAIFKSSGRWWRWASRSGSAILRVLLRPVRRAMLRLVREVVTEHMMTLTVSGKLYSLAQPIPLPPSPALQTITNPDLVALMSTVPAAIGDPGNVGATDWSDFGQRMRFIAYLFRVYHERAEARTAPFTTTQIAGIRAGQIPDGQL